MKHCLNCNIKIGGTWDECPICQNTLGGNETVNLWPDAMRLKKAAFLYKLQLFLILASTAVCLIIDFLMEVHRHKHWSLIVALWALFFEILISKITERKNVPAKIFTLSTFEILLILMLTGYYLDFFWLCIYYFAPISISVMLILNFIFSLADKHSNALVYLLCNLIVAIVPYMIFYVYFHKVHLTWSVCLILSAITFIGIIVFKGRAVTSEIQKRLNF